MLDIRGGHLTFLLQISIQMRQLVYQGKKRIVVFPEDCCEVQKKLTSTNFRPALCWHSSSCNDFVVRCNSH